MNNNLIYMAFRVMYIVPQKEGGETMKKITVIEASKQVRKETRVAAYARVSTSSDGQLTSLEAQMSYYEKYIKAHSGWTFAGIYYDEGISGTKADKRTGLQNLIKACEQGKIDFIIVKSISRFSRNTVDSLEIVRKLCGLGVHLFFEKENINTGNMESELLLSILSSLAESESRSISDNIKWSIKKRFMDGTFKPGCVPYGYSQKDGEFTINENEAKVVERIYESFVSGMSMDSIAAMLNSESIKAPRGNKWGGGTIKGILTNEKYIGDALFQKRYTDDQFNSHRNYGEVDQYYIKDHHEPIIDEALFDLASEVIKRNCREKGIEQGVDKYNKRYAFSGRILCAECGSKWKRVKIGDSFSYACKGHIKDISSCSIKAIPEDAIKAAFTTMMNKLIFSNKKILIPFLENSRAFENENAYERIVEIERELDAIASKRSRVVRLFAKGFLDPGSFAQENESIDISEEKLKKEYQDIQNGITDNSHRLEEIADLIVFCSSTETMMHFDEELFTRFVDHIEIYNRTKLGFVMKCGPTFKEEIKL